MKLYKIKNWAAIYENNRTRELKNMAWIPVPNSHDGDGYTMIVSRKNGAAILGAWLVILQVASRCDPRGTLLRGCGKPHDEHSIARITRLSTSDISEAMRLCEEIQWIESEQFAIPHDGASIPHDGASIPHLTDEEQNRTEQNRKEGKEGKVASLPKPSLEEVKFVMARIGLPESDAVWFWNKCEGNGWTNGGKPIKSWPHVISSWKAAGYLPSQKAAASQPKFGSTICPPPYQSHKGGPL